eukprot:RCo036509
MYFGGFSGGTSSTSSVLSTGATGTPSLSSFPSSFPSQFSAQNTSPYTLPFSTGAATSTPSSTFPSAGTAPPAPSWGGWGVPLKAPPLGSTTTPPAPSFPSQPSSFPQFSNPAPAFPSFSSQLQPSLSTTPRLPTTALSFPPQNPPSATSFPPAPPASFPVQAPATSAPAPPVPPPAAAAPVAAPPLEIQKVLVTGEARLIPAEAEKGVEAIKEMQKAAQAEPGCVAFLWTRSLEDESLVYIYEVWENDEALSRHLDSEHVRVFKEVVPDIFVDDPKVQKATLGTDFEEI